MLNQLLQSNLCLCFWRYLIEHGAQVGAVNSEGELPLDVATEDAMERLLKAEIKKQGVESRVPILALLQACMWSPWQYFRARDYHNVP